MIAGNAAQTVFDAGTLANKQRAAEETFAQSTAQYYSTVLMAFQNVADTLRALQADARSVSAAIAAERSAARNIALVRQQVEHGQVSTAGPAQRAASLSADFARARAGRGLAPCRHGRAVPGAGRRLVEQAGSSRSAREEPL